MRHSKYILFITALTFNFSSCGDTKKKNTNSSENIETVDDRILVTKEQFENSGMVVGSFEEKSFPITVQTNGMIDVPPENRAVVSATMGGYIKTTPLLIGDIVKKGQVLVTIENPEFVTLQQEYMEAKQRLTFLQSEFERQKILREENITSQKSFLKAESEFKTANVRYIGLRKQLTMLNISPVQVENGSIGSIATIFAPIGGSITQMNVTKGTYVSPSSAILEIIDNDHIHLELSVFEKDIMKVEKGQAIKFKIPEASEKTFDAEVYLIGTSIGENRTIKVHGHLKDESKNDFLTGMFVDASIITADTVEKALPSEAIVNVDDTSYLLLLNNENNSERYFKSMLVKTGATTDGFTAIKNAEKFQPNDRFLVKGAFELIQE